MKNKYTLNDVLEVTANLNQKAVKNFGALLKSNSAPLKEELAELFTEDYDAIFGPYYHGRDQKEAMQEFKTDEFSLIFIDGKRVWDHMKGKYKEGFSNGEVIPEKFSYLKKCAKAEVMRALADPKSEVEIASIEQNENGEYSVQMATVHAKMSQLLEKEKKEHGFFWKNQHSSGLKKYREEEKEAKWKDPANVSRRKERRKAELEQIYRKELLAKIKKDHKRLFAGESEAVNADVEKLVKKAEKIENEIVAECLKQNGTATKSKKRISPLESEKRAQAMSEIYALSKYKKQDMKQLGERMGKTTPPFQATGLPKRFKKEEILEEISELDNDLLEYDSYMAAKRMLERKYLAYQRLMMAELGAQMMGVILQDYMDTSDQPLSFKDAKEEEMFQDMRKQLGDARKMASEGKVSKEQLLDMGARYHDFLLKAMVSQSKYMEIAGKEEEFAQKYARREELYSMLGQYQYEKSDVKLIGSWKKEGIKVENPEKTKALEYKDNVLEKVMKKEKGAMKKKL